MRRHGDIVVRTDAEHALALELEEQKSLFTELNNRAVSRGRPAPYPDVGATMLSMQIVKRGDQFVVTKRKERLEEVDWDLSGHSASVRSSRSYGERMGADKMSRDETRLFLQGNMDCAVEVGEISESWRVCL